MAFSDPSTMGTNIEIVAFAAIGADEGIFFTANYDSMPNLRDTSANSLTTPGITFQGLDSVNLNPTYPGTSTDTSHTLNTCLSNSIEADESLITASTVSISSYSEHSSGTTTQMPFAETSEFNFA